MNKTKMLESLEKSKSGLFGTRDTIDKANQYGVELVKASGRDQINFSMQVALCVYHYTLIDQVIKMVNSMED